MMRHTSSKHPWILSGQRQVNKTPKRVSPVVPLIPDPQNAATCTEFSQKTEIVSTRTQSTSQRRVQTKNLITMMAKNYLPFTLVEDRYFLRFLKEYDANFKMPTRKTLSNGILSNCYNEIKDKVLNEVKKVKFLALATDFWTSSNNSSYISLTGHFLDENSRLKSTMLDCVYLHEKEESFMKVLAVCQDWEIMDKIVGVTTADIVVEVLKNSSWESIPCMAHSIDFIVRSAIKKGNIFHKVLKISEFFQKNPLASNHLESLQQKQEQNSLKLKKENQSTWISTFHMFQRTLDLQKVINETISTNYSEDLEPINDEEIQVLSKLCEILQYFEFTTLELSSEKKVLISEVILIINSLILRCKKFIATNGTAESVECLLKGLETHYKNMEFNPIYGESTVLDPRFKNLGFTNQSAFQSHSMKIKSRIKSPVRLLIESIDDEPHPIYEYFDNIPKDLAVEIEHNSEWVRYMEEPFLHRSLDPLEWWERKKHAYTGLYEIVLQRFSVPVTSVPAERLFSKADQSVTYLRNGLQGGKVSKIVFLNHNL